MTVLKTVAMDIETTGFDVEDQLTVIGFDSNIGSQVFLATGETRCPATLEGQVNGHLTAPVTVSVHETERRLLMEMREFVESTLTGKDIKLVAYNG